MMNKYEAHLCPVCSISTVSAAGDWCAPCQKSARVEKLQRKIKSAQREYEEEIGEPLTSHTQRYKGNPAAEGAAAAKRDDAERYEWSGLVRSARLEEFDLSDMLDFARALAKVSDDHRVDVLCLINEDFGGISHDNMIDVRRVLSEKGTCCDALDDLLDEFFAWYRCDQQERSQ